MPHISWLDRMVNDRMANEMANLKARTAAQFLTVEFVRFETDILYCELGGALPSQTGLVFGTGLRPQTTETFFILLLTDNVFWHVFLIAWQILAAWSLIQRCTW